MNTYGYAVGCLLAGAVLGFPALAGETSGLNSRWSARLELEGRYDDNVTELSDRDKSRVGDPAYADRFRIETAGDYAWIPSGRIAWSGNLARHVTTTVQGEAHVFRYVRDTVKNYEVIGLRLEQDLSPAKVFNSQLILRVSDTPSYYLRELRVPATTAFDSARYSSLEYGIGLDQVLVPRLLYGTVQVSRDNRDYDLPFNERDGDLTGYGAAIEIGPRGRRLGLRVGYEKSRYDARGDDISTAAIEPDISTDRNELSARVAFRWALGYVVLSGA